MDKRKKRIVVMLNGRNAGSVVLETDKEPGTLSPREHAEAERRLMGQAREIPEIHLALSAKELGGVSFDGATLHIATRDRARLAEAEVLETAAAFLRSQPGGKPQPEDFERRVDRAVNALLGL